MVLKVKRYKSKHNKQDWWYFDNIRKLSTEQRCCKTIEEINDFCGEKQPYSILLDFIDSDIARELSEHDGGRIDICFMICRLIDGSEWTVLFDTQAFILNDEGKTIDRIVCNVDPNN